MSQARRQQPREIHPSSTGIMGLKVTFAGVVLATHSLIDYDGKQLDHQITSNGPSCSSVAFVA